MLDNSRFEDLRSTAHRILKLVEDYGLPLTPRIFEVLSHYLSHDDPEFRDAVATALDASPAGREDALNLTYMTFLGNAALEEGLEKVRAHLARELAEVTEKINMGMRGNAQMIKILQSSMRDLAGSITREGVQSVAREISTTGKSQLSDTTVLSDRLNRTQFQLNRMQRELESLRESASTDHLTKLANRRLMDERLRQMLDGDQEFCLAMVDIDHFKRINDTWGHAVGDTVLQGLGQYLRDNLKGRDFAARIGGEEFAIFLPDTPLDGAETLCTGLCRGFHAIHWVNQQTREEIGQVSMSIGVTARQATDSAESLLHRADGLLYKAKDAGRNRVIAA